jgi:hypothetical protein
MKVALILGCRFRVSFRENGGGLDGSWVLCSGSVLVVRTMVVVSVARIVWTVVVVTVVRIV